MDNQSSLGGPLCCCEKLCVNEMLYFFCTHQLSSVLYDKHCFVATFVPCMNDSLIQITPPFFRIMIFFPDIFNLLKLLNNLMEFISIIFFRTDIDDKIIYNIGITQLFYNFTEILIKSTFQIWKFLINQQNVIEEWINSIIINFNIIIIRK